MKIFNWMTTIVLLGILTIACGCTSINARSPEAEIEHCTTTINLPDISDEEKSTALVNRALAYAKLGQLRKSIYDSILVIDMPDAPLEQVERALVNMRAAEKTLNQTKNHEEELANQTIIINDPNALPRHKALAFLFRGDSYLVLEEVDMAIVDYSSLINMSDAPAELKARALFNRAYQYVKLESYDKAIVDCTRIIKMPEVTSQKVKAKQLRNICKNLKKPMVNVVTVSHILIKVDHGDTETVKSGKRAKLETIRESINAGTITFEDAAIKYSDCPTGSKGGSLKPFGKGTMAPEFEAAAYSQAIGEIGPIIETQFGYHIVKVTNKD